jgi:hypothetical protein
MPPKPPARTDWRPVDILAKGPELVATLDRDAIRQCLERHLPNWCDLDDGGRSAAFQGAVATFAFLAKHRMDDEGRPRIATVKAALNRIEKAAEKLGKALDALDLRTLGTLAEVAGRKASAPNSMPLNESPLPPSPRGHHRLKLFRSALGDAGTWAATALRESPKSDARATAYPGLQDFARDMAHLWETYGGVTFTASRNRGRATDFIAAMLSAGGKRYPKAAVLKAAQSVASDLKRNHPDRIVVAPEERHLKLAELVRRKSLPKKRKRSVTR